MPVPQRLRLLLVAWSLVVWSLVAAAAAAAAPVPVVRFSWDSEASAAVARRCAEIWRAEGPALVARLSPADAPGDTVDCLVAGTAEFTRLFARAAPDWGVGLALPTGRAVALDRERLPAVGRGVREVFLHEMAHALLFQATVGAWLPSWFHEGVAMETSGEWRFTDTVSLALDGHVPDLVSLQGRFPAVARTADRAYRTSLLAVRHLEDKHGPGAVPRVLAATARRGDFHAGFREATGEDIDAFSRDFAARMRLRFGWLILLTRWPAMFVLLALVLAVGAIRKIVVSRRRLAAMDGADADEPI